MSNNLSSSNTSFNNGQKSLPPNHHKIWVTDDGICYLVGGKKATVRARSEAESQKLHGGSVCLICSSTSNEHHYGARSCNKCSDFFKRSVLNRLEYICTMGGRCRLVGEELDRACSACRLRKCIFNGMSIERVRQEKGEEAQQAVAVLASKPAATTASSRSPIPIEMRPTTMNTVVANWSATFSLANQFRDRITFANGGAVRSAVTARDNVARDVQLFVNTLLNVGRHLISQIDTFMERQLEADRERLKQLDELEKNLKTYPNSTEANSKLSAFLKEHFSVSSTNITYEPSKSMDACAAITLLFNEPLINESPLPPVRPTSSDATLPIISTLPNSNPSTSKVVTKPSSTPAEFQRSAESANSSHDVAQTSSTVVDQPTTTTRESSQTADDNMNETAAATSARKATKRSAADNAEGTPATVSGGGPASAKRKQPISEPTVTRDEPEEMSKRVNASVTKRSKLARRIDSSDSEASTTSQSEKRIRMEKQFQKQMRRRPRAEEALCRQLEASSEETMSCVAEEPTEKRRAGEDKSEKKNKKDKHEKEKNNAKHAENQKNDDKENSTRECVPQMPNSSGDNRASSSSHPSLKKKKDKRHTDENLSANSSKPMSDWEKSLLKEKGFTSTNVIIMHMDVSTMISRHNVKTAEISSSKIDKTRDESKAAVIHNFISNQKATSLAADARSSPNPVMTDCLSSSERTRKVISEQPSPSSLAGSTKESEKTASGQPQP